MEKPFGMSSLPDDLLTNLLDIVSAPDYLDRHPPAPPGDAAVMREARRRYRDVVVAEVERRKAEGILPGKLETQNP